ncbi:hypothetical protein Q75_17240 [Bacillus coahuilensis p1.1.43]|uniref:Uncharacterized protein n=2 Tax=Bacillus coahuilensis TaxID=408580 RepID=A0A147K3U7_9BACI|nr:hypothetical protein [Bacillus coahuilensis]KUP03925.1 hypothetical protein Q75_17240 [Bacillus coahuilensis p1.1.43]
MKIYLISLQCLYFFTFIPWVAIWGLSFMSFDGGVGVWNSLFVLIITIYPAAVILCSILSWLLLRKNEQQAIWVSLVPMLWVISFGILMIL